MEYEIKDLNTNQLKSSSIRSLLEIYKTIPIVFDVRSKYLFKDNMVEGKYLIQKEIKVEPYFKNYDDFEDPIQWSENWDIKNWGIIVMHHSNDLIGGAIIAWKTDGVNMLENRDDLAVLWDIRIHPDYRNKGVGKELFNYATNWSIDRKCTELKIETQNNNIGAINFYIKMDCEIKEINYDAYPDLPDEVQVIFRKKLD